MCEVNCFCVSAFSILSSVQFPCLDSIKNMIQLLRYHQVLTKICHFNTLSQTSALPLNAQWSASYTTTTIQSWHFKAVPVSNIPPEILPVAPVQCAVERISVGDLLSFTSTLFGRLPLLIKSISPFAMVVDLLQVESDCCSTGLLYVWPGTVCLVSCKFSKRQQRC